jgi:peroxiredoxin
LQITCNTSTMVLEDMPLDIGYASEPATVTGSDGKAHTLGGQNGKTQLIVSAPFIDDAFIEELTKIDRELPVGEEAGFTATLVVANDTHSDPQLKHFDFYIDSDGEFGDWYGVRLVGAPCDGELAKALFVISKDGALFYDEFADNLHHHFNTETLLRKIAAAQECYTGKGCH